MITLHTKVNNGKLSKSVSNEIKIFLDMFEGKYIEIVLKKARSKRSDPQNRYYWGAVIPIVQSGLKDLGYRMSKEETHDFLRDKFLFGEMISKDGELIGKQRKSTTTLTKSEFSDYIADIQQFGAEILGVIIPDPLQQTELQLTSQ